MTKGTFSQPTPPPPITFGLAIHYTDILVCHYLTITSMANRLFFLNNLRSRCHLCQGSLAKLAFRN